MAAAARRASKVPFMARQQYQQAPGRASVIEGARRMRHIFGQEGIGGDAMDTDAAARSDEEWRKVLSPEQYKVLRKHGTERAGTSPLNAEKRTGTFVCAGCGQPVYRSDTKFESGTGWPSFWAPIDGAVETSSDRSWFMARTEVHCARCQGHLGHVFEDGPKPTG